MPTSRPFAYNPSQTSIPGVDLFGYLSVGPTGSGKITGLTTWNGPNEDLGYVIAKVVPGNTQPTPIVGVSASVGFYRSATFSDVSFLYTVNRILNSNYVNGQTANNYLISNGYWTNYPVSGGGTFTPGDFAFNDGDVAYTTNTVTFTKSGRLYIEGSTSAGANSATAYLNNQIMFFYGSTGSAVTYPNSFNDNQGGYSSFIYLGRYGVFDVNTGDTMYFNISSNEPQNDTSTITFRIDSFTGTLIDSFTATFVGGCYLTTATVQYKGLLDDGPELTAMRQLREHYRGDIYYDNLIVEYYQNATSIIQGIDNSLDPSIDYEFIYQSVLKVKNYIDQSMWEEAKDEYITTYFVLKNRYIITPT